MNVKNILVGAGIVAFTFGLLFFIYQLVNKPIITEFPEAGQLRKEDHVTWSKNSKDLLVEYSDIQCPACKGFHDLFKSFEASTSPDFAITKKVTLVYRHFPLYQLHKNAFNAAYAAEAASLQGKFWEMADILFARQSQWSELTDPKDFFAGVAKELNLDLDKFKKDIDSQNVKDIVQLNLTEGEKIGVDATPTFFLNSKKVEVKSIDDFKKLLLSL
ncbi:thioredoxin domain-containing protein [Candidatus Roizmanbacteria bacterium]|nr:thioredoxin domain-containing protein [Candidatus Roizmanbacteria bacterium]